MNIKEYSTLVDAMPELICMLNKEILNKTEEYKLYEYDEDDKYFGIFLDIDMFQVQILRNKKYQIDEVHVLGDDDFQIHHIVCLNDLSQAKYILSELYDSISESTEQYFEELKISKEDDLANLNTFLEDLGNQIDTEYNDWEV